MIPTLCLQLLLHDATTNLGMPLVSGPPLLTATTTAASPDHARSSSDSTLADYLRSERPRDYGGAVEHHGLSLL